MKRSRFLIFLLTLSLFACNSEPNWIEYKSESEVQETHETETEEIFPYVHVEDKPYSFNAIRGNNFLKYSDGYIYFYNGSTDFDNGIISTVKRLDPQTGEITSVCPDPLCAHNSPECDLYGFSNSNYVADNSLFFIRQYHYVIRDEEGVYIDSVDHADYVRYDMETNEVQIYEDHGEELGYYNYELQIFVDGYQYYYDNILDEEKWAYFFKMCRRVHIPSPKSGSTVEIEHRHRANCARIPRKLSSTSA